MKVTLNDSQVRCAIIQYVQEMIDGNHKWAGDEEDVVFDITDQSGEPVMVSDVEAQACMYLEAKE